MGDVHDAFFFFKRRLESKLGPRRQVRGLSFPVSIGARSFLVDGLQFLRRHPNGEQCLPIPRVVPESKNTRSQGVKASRHLRLCVFKNRPF